MTTQGLDLEAVKRTGRFSFVDGLTGLVAGDAGSARDRVIKSAKEADVRKEIDAAVAGLKTTKQILIVDQPDLLLALAQEGSVTSGSLSSLLLSLREVCFRYPHLDNYATDDFAACSCNRLDSVCR
jgi:elongator complex protein 6